MQKAVKKTFPQYLKTSTSMMGHSLQMNTPKARIVLKQGKSAGPDNIPPEMFKNCELGDIVLVLCNIALMKNDKSDQWTLFNIIPVLKKGGSSKTDNYRGISLMCIIGKLYNHMMLSRIQMVLESKLRSNQNGFRQLQLHKSWH